MCRTGKRTPDGFFGAGRGLGFGLANQLVRLSRDGGGRGQSPLRKFWQSICPSKPPTSALATTCVMTAPRPRAPYVVAHVDENLNCWQAATVSSGPSVGSASVTNLATWRPARHAPHLFPA
jgi:hypothetical protein